MKYCIYSCPEIFILLLSIVRRHICMYVYICIYMYVYRISYNFFYTSVIYIKIKVTYQPMRNGRSCHLRSYYDSVYKHKIYIKIVQRSKQSIFLQDNIYAEFFYLFFIKYLVSNYIFYKKMFTLVNFHQVLIVFSFSNYL